MTQEEKEEEEKGVDSNLTTPTEGWGKNYTRVATMGCVGGYHRHRLDHAARNGTHLGRARVCERTAPPPTAHLPKKETPTNKECHKT